MILTQRDLATGVTKNDYIHIVITGDTSQNPEGSSYKARVGQILELYNLPVPNIRLLGTDGGLGESVATLNINNTVGSDIEIINPPYITVSNLSQEQIDNNVFIEMVQYKNKKKRSFNDGRGYVGGRYVVQPRIEDDGVGGVRNELEYRIWNYYGKTITDRGGIAYSNSDGQPLAVNRRNHYQVSVINQDVNLAGYFAGRFTYDTIYYLDETGNPASVLDVPVPTTNRSKNYSETTLYDSSKSKRKSGNTGTPYEMCYMGNLTSLYVAFRYIMFDPDSNDGKGKFVTGPLTPIIKVTNKYFPLVKTTTEGWCKKNPILSGQESKIICSFINKP